MGSGRDEFLRQLFQQPHGQQSARIQKQQTAAQQFMEQLPRNQIDAYRNSPQGMAEIDGVVGMSPTAAQLVRSAQQWGGKGTGDAARAVIQSPATIWGGLKGGVHALNSGFYRAADDLSFNSFGTGTLGDWAKNQSNLSHDAQRNATINYQTDIGRDVGQGLNSFGATAPLTVGALAMKNPAIMYGGMGAQTGLTEYGNARDAGVSPIPAAIYATTQGAIEVGTEKLPAGALVDMVKSNRPLAALVKAPARYALGEGLGEQVATLGQDYMQAAYLDAPKNANWQQDYWNSRGEAARTTAVSSLVSSGGNVGLGAGGVAVQRGVNAVRARQKPPVQRFMQQLDTQTAQPQAQPAQQPASSGRMAKGSGNAVVDTTRRIQQATANGGYQTRPSPAADLQSLTGNAAVERSVQLMIHHESRGKVNAQNPLSSAGGLGGFIDSTWLTMVKRYRPDVAAGKSNAQIIALKTRDGALATEMTRHYIQENARHLEKNGLPSTMANLRLAHWFGAGGAVQLLNVANKNQPIANVVSPAVMKANPNIQGKTVQQVIDITHREMYGKAAQNMGRMAKGSDSAGMPDSPDASPALPDRQAAFSNGMEDNSQAMQEMQRAARESQAAAEEMREQSERLGRQTKVYLDNQMRQARLQLMEADELAPSVAGTDNQYRDRSRAASQMQVNHIAQNLEPELLGDSKEVGTGAPTLANDGRTIIGGNGRVMGLAQAYANGNGEGYRQYLLDNAEQFGLSRDEIARMNKPVLVRQLDESVDIAKAAVASNEGGGLGMSALEQARADADRLPDFGRFIADDSGELNTAANRGFIRDFVGAMPHTVRAQMVDADGRLSQDGVRRLRNALLYRAYGNSPTLSRMVESTDQGARNLVNALVQAAPKIAQARDNIQAGNMHNADIAEEVVQAAEKLNQIREQGGSVADYLAQQGLFGEEMNAVSRELLAFFEEHKRSGKAIATLLRNYYDALAAQGNPNQQDVFGEQAAPDKQQLLERTINDYEQEHGRSADSGQLFGRTAERPAVEPVSETEPQPASRRSDEAGAGENQGGTERDGERSGRVAGEDAPKLSRSASTQEKYEQRIDELFAGAKANVKDGVTVLDRSDMLDMLGFGDKPLKLAEGKVLAGIDNHPAMTAEVWKRLPEWVDKPAMVFDSDTVDGRLVFIAPEKVRGSDVRIVIEPKGDALEAHVLVNAYNKDSKSPYFRWVNDRLLRYADKEKASRIDERFGLRLPDILRNPAFMPDAQIHGMGRGNMKALRRTKILTEKNLQGYLKNNPALSLNHSGNTPSTATPERVAEIRQQVARAVGQRNMRLIDVLTAEEARRPDGAQDLRGVDGWYDPKSKRITLIADNLPNARAAQFAAWHELGHRKIDVAGWQQWRGVLEQARLNPTIQQLARTILRQRKAAGEAINIDIATEEAAVELYSAMKNSDYAVLEDKYKVSVPLAMRGGLAGYFARFAQRLQSVLAKAFGIRQAEFGDGEVFELLRKIDRAEEVAGSLNASQEKYSRSLTDEQKQFDETAQKYGGEEAYEQAKADGETELTYRQWVQVRTPAFKQWFGDWESDPANASKVVNQKTGEPLVVYHGTDAEFNVFDRNELGYHTYSNASNLFYGMTAGVGHWFNNQNLNETIDYGKRGIGAFLNIREPGHFDSVSDLAVDIEYSGFIPEDKRNLWDFDDTQEISDLVNKYVADLKDNQDTDGLIVDDEEYGGISYVAFDANQIKSATDNSGAFNAGDDDIRYSRSTGELTDKAKPGWLDRNELGEWEKGLAAYHSLGRLVKPVLAKLKLANTAPQEFTEMMRDYRSQLNVAGMTASEMAQAGVQMTAEERALLSDILEKELPPGIEVSPEMQELAGTIRELLSRQGEQLADLGMLSRESLERFKDTYLPRLYRQRTELFGGNDLAKLNREFNKAMRGGLGNALGGQHLKGRGIFKTVSRSEQADYKAKGYELRQDFGNQGKHAGKVLMWRDYTREERAQMGEERDAILRFTQGYVQTQADLAKGVLFQRIAQNEELASKTEVEGWEKVPDTTIAGTGGVHRYGALAGMYVHPDVYYHLEQQFAVQNAALKIWRASLGWWKMTKTVYNPVAHTNNVVSNFSLLFIAGGRVRDLQPAAASIRNKDALYREALELGLVGEAVDSAGIRELFTGLNNTDDDAVITDSFFRRVLKRADRLALGIPGKISDKAQTFYRVEDEVFKMALYRMARSKGLSNTEARDYTLNFFFDYGEVPKGIQLVRDTGLLPFVSYTYKAIPAVLRGALTRPHRYLAVTGLMYALNAMSYAMLGDDADEEEERKYMPEYMKGFTSFGTPKLIRLPWNDSQGKPMFIDVYRWLPLGDFADVGNRTGGLPVPQFMNPNGPVVSTYNAMVNNTDTFTGGKLTQDYMTDGEKTVVRAKWIAGQILPASVGMPFSYHSNNVMDGLKNQMEGTKFAEVLEDLGWTGKTYRGEDKQLYRAALGAFGIKVRGEKPEDLRAATQRRLHSQEREIRADMRRIRRNNTLSPQAKEAQLARRQQSLQRLFEQMPGRSAD
nr:MAG TPA: crystallin beta/gamma motif-containing protein [Caudoviricetes sp.]